MAKVADFDQRKRAEICNYAKRLGALDSRRSRYGNVVADTTAENGPLVSVASSACTR